MKINTLLTIVFFMGIIGLSQVSSQDLATLNASIVALNNALNSISWIAGASTVKYSNDGVNLFNYMYRDAVIYDDVIAAYQTKVFEKRGAIAGWDETSYATASTKWNNKKILRIGGGVQASNANGMTVHVPNGYNVLWLRCLNDRWETFRVMSATNAETQQAIYSCGYRNLNEISPDGAGPDSYNTVHMWVPIPLYFSGDYWVFPDANSDDWISGIAFGKNLWNHAMNSAVAYYWNLNGGTTVGWDTENWNSDNLAHLPAQAITDLYVPVVPSGKNKLVYIVEYNNNVLGTMHGAVQVNGNDIERFRSTYSNPFATHHSSKFYQRYIAAMVPASYVQNNAKFIKLTIDLSNSDTVLYFREIGTHDYI
jgi:hypothetical protein